MQTIEITSFSGTTPFSATICDITLNYCYLVQTGISSVPVTLNVPTVLQSANQLIVKLIDSNSCEYIELFSCVTPTPTPTPTLTPTPSMVINCNCITFDNLTGVDDYEFSLTQCDGTILTSVVYAGTSVYYCGKLPSSADEVIITIGLPCIDDTTCPTPEITPTSTPTNTPTPTITPTPTPTASPILPYLLQEDGSYLLQEDGGKIIIT